MYDAVLVIQSILCGVACAWIARRKERRWGLWLVIGALFSLFGVVAVLGVGSRAEAESLEPEASSGSLTARSYLEEGSVIADVLQDEKQESSFVVRSPNERYRAVALDGSPNDKGTVALAHKDEVLWEKELSRPNMPSISNTGIVTVESWERPGNHRSALFVFSPEGGRLLVKEYRVHSFRSGVSENGQLAWFMGAGARDDDPPETNTLFVYDLPSGETLLETEPPFRTVTNVHRDGDALRVDLDGFICRYENGDMVESDNYRWEKEERNLNHTGSPNYFAKVIHARLNRAHELTDEQLEHTLERADAFAADGSDGACARFYRRKGELLEHMGRKRHALKAFKTALSHDDSVGVKQKAEQLRKSLSLD